MMVPFFSTYENFREINFTKIVDHTHKHNSNFYYYTPKLMKSSVIVNIFKKENDLAVFLCLLLLLCMILITAI